MLNSALALQMPLTALCASQQMGLSMKAIALTAQDWAVLRQLRDLLGHLCQAIREDTRRAISYLELRTSSILEDDRQAL